jgi:hypothetical protein
VAPLSYLRKGGSMKDETVRGSQGQGVVDQFEVVGIDAALLLEEKSLGRVLRVVENLGKDRS